jgi:hypothetical protein
MGTQSAGRHTVDSFVTKLIALSRNAHAHVDLDDPADYWYRLGQRNAYAYAVGLVVSRGADEAAFEVSDRITKELSEGHTDLAALEQAAAGSAGPADDVTWEWFGPNAFRARHGDVPGIDRDFGMRWGERGDIRISLRSTLEATSGMLYAYDPLWDEYAVLGRDVPTAAVEAAFTQALQVDIHMDVAAFNEIVRSHLVLGAALPSQGLMAGRVIEP